MSKSLHEYFLMFTLASFNRVWLDITCTSAVELSPGIAVILDVESTEKYTVVGKYTKEFPRFLLLAIRSLSVLGLLTKVRYPSRLDYKLAALYLNKHMLDYTGKVLLSLISVVWGIILATD